MKTEKVRSTHEIEVEVVGEKDFPRWGASPAGWAHPDRYQRRPDRATVEHQHGKYRRSDLYHHPANTESEWDRCLPGLAYRPPCRELSAGRR